MLVETTQEGPPVATPQRAEIVWHDRPGYAALLYDDLHSLVDFMHGWASTDVPYRFDPLAGLTDAAVDLRIDIADAADSSAKTTKH